MTLFAVTYDRDYGIAKRTGWSVCINGIWVVRFERFLIVALWKAWRARRSMLKWPSGVNPVYDHMKPVLLPDDDTWRAECREESTKDVAARFGLTTDQLKLHPKQQEFIESAELHPVYRGRFWP